MQTKDRWNKVTNKWETQQVQAVTYGYELCRNLAEHMPASTTYNPDNIGFFGLAMFLDEWDWSRGYAMPKKKTA